MKKYYLFLIASFLCPALLVHAQTPDVNGIVYVKTNGVGNGSSWANATSNLQGAIDAVGTQAVFVAKGTYNVPSSNSFVMKNTVAIYGGFDPDNGIDDLNDVRILPSLGQQGSILNGKNERTVVKYAGGSFTDTTILDGFTITGGAGTSGGGINTNGGSPTFRNLLLKGNSASIGGGIYNASGKPMLFNVAIVDNIARQGGGFFGFTSLPVFINVTIAGNTITGDNTYTGSAIHLTDCTLQLSNTIVFGVIYNDNSLQTSQNSLIEGRSSTTNNNINATGILPAHVFVAPTNGNYTLVSGAPVIDKGNGTLFTGLSSTSKDLSGKFRSTGNAIDLGAYEYYTATPSAGGIVYVNVNGTGSGTSWADAIGDLHAAIGANGVQQVWVAKGTYQVSANSFVMKNGVAIYGGFDPDNGIDDLTDQRILEARGGATNGSILSGRNERPVIWNFASSGSPMNATAVLDGFTLANGAGGNSNNGGGAIYNMYASPKLNNLVIKNNSASYGGGVYNGNNSAPIFMHCVFFNNQTSGGGGGAMCNNFSNPKLYNCLFYSNTSYLGGAIYNQANAFPDLRNCTLVSNHATAFGGAVNSMGFSNPHFANCIIFGNTAGFGDNGIVRDVSIGNPASSYNASLIQDATSFDENDNISFGGTITDIFNDPVNHNYTLKAGGPAINMGRNSYPNEAGITTDLAGNSRIRGSSVDLGVYEADACAVTSIIYVDATVNNNGSNPMWVTPITGNGASWATAYKTLKDALNLANQCANITEIRVAKGTYYPTGMTGILGSKDISFTVKRSNLKILGGYNASTGLRDVAANLTILSGNVSGDPTYHVVRLSNIPTTGNLVIDGFTIANGLANNENEFLSIANGGYVYHDSGAGLHMVDVGDNVLIRNCIFQNNKATLGGGIFSELSYAVFEHCTFKNNMAVSNSFFGGSGAGMYSSSAQHQMDDCMFTGNVNTGSDGGGLFADNATFFINNGQFTNNTTVGNGGALVLSGSQSVLNNCIFSGNTANKDGGAVYQILGNPKFTNVAINNNGAAANGGGFYNLSGNPVFTNATIVNNTAAAGQAFYVSTGTPMVNNSIAYGGVTGSYIPKYSLIEGNVGGSNGNLDGTVITPASLFVNPSTKNYTLLSTSPVLNAGNNTLFIGLNLDTKDLAGNARVYNSGMIDLGAYEYQGEPVLPVTLVSFTAKKESNHAKLLWETAMEQYSQKFEVYRSGEDKRFNKLGEVAGKHVASSYFFTDKQPLNGNNYYRLVQVDVDGKPTDLGERVLNFDLVASNITVYPNPTVNNATVVFRANKYNQAVLSNVEGKILQKKHLGTAQTEATFNLADYPRGVYFIRLTGVGGDVVQKVIKF